MDTMIVITPEKVGLLIWLIWALIGVVAALVAQRLMPLRQMLAFNIIVGVVSACLGGFLSVQFVGGTTMMLFFISILGAVFGAGIILWIVAALTMHFSGRQ